MRFFNYPSIDKIHGTCPIVSTSPARTHHPFCSPPTSLILAAVVSALLPATPAAWPPRYQELVDAIGLCFGDLPCPLRGHRAHNSATYGNGRYTIIGGLQINEDRWGGLHVRAKSVQTTRKIDTAISRKVGLPRRLSSELCPPPLRRFGTRANTLL